MDRTDGSVSLLMFHNNPDVRHLPFRLIGDYSIAPQRKFFNVLFYAEHPSARGHVHITSAEDVFASPDFQPGYLAP